MLFNKPPASFINDIIDIDRPNNHKTRLEVVSWLKNHLLPHTTQQFWRFHLSYRGKHDKKGSVKYSIHCYFATYLPASLPVFSGKPTQARTSGYSHQTKIYKMPLYWLVGFFRCSPAVSNSTYTSEMLWKYSEMQINSKSYNLRIYFSSCFVILSFASFSFFFNSSLSFRFLRKERAHSYTVQLWLKPTK